MPISATGATEAPTSPAHRRTRGFTLVELLVVIVIVSVIGSLVVVGIGRTGPGERAERELRRLSASLDAVCDRALLTGTAHGVRFHSRGYDFWIHRDGWQPLTATGAPTERRWPSGLNPRVRVERIAVSGRADSAPQVVCTGLEPPASLSIEIGTGEARRRSAWPR